MKDLTRLFPVGADNYTVIDVRKWYSNSTQIWVEKEPQMLEWLRNLDHPSWFSWERPSGQMIFGDSDVAALFVLRWSS